MIDALAMANKIGQNSDSFIVGCIIWIPFALWCIFLVRQLVDQNISFIVAFVAFMVLVLLVWAVNNIWHPAFAWGILTVMVAPIVLYPAILLFLNEREIHLVEVEGLEQSYAQLGQQPLNTVTKCKVAEYAWNCGYLGHAIALADNALAGQRRDLFRWEIAMVERWKQEYIPPRKWEPIACLRCQTAIPPRPDFFCPRCGAPYLADNARARLTPVFRGQKWVAAWAVGALVVVGMPYVSMAPWPNEYKIGTILILTVLGILALVSAFRQAPKATT